MYTVDVFRFFTWNNIDQIRVKDIISIWKQFCLFFNIDNVIMYDMC